MGFKMDEIVRVKRGPKDQGHGGKQGQVIEIKTLSGVQVAKFPVSGEAEKWSYKIGFPPGEYKDWGWYVEDDLEKI
jgi:hypothetical protein